MSNVQPFFSEKTLNAQRSTLNAQQFSAFTVGRWTLDVGRCRAIAGGVAERLIAPVLKTGRPKGLVSSNLTPSALLRTWRFAGLRCSFARSRTPSEASAKEGQCITSILLKVAPREVNAM